MKNSIRLLLALMSIFCVNSLSQVSAETWSFHQVRPDQCTSLHSTAVGGLVFRIQGFSALVPDPNFDPSLDTNNRYQSYGTVMPDNLLAPDGWDWSRWPGATTIYLPPETLAENLKEPRNELAFVGNSHLASRIGIFAMRFHDEAFDRTFWFKKSVFSFGDKIICLGSDIENHDYQNETTTTLFQTPLSEKNTPIYVNSLEPVTSFPDAVALELNESVWLMDAMGIGYVVSPEQAVRVTRRTQSSVSDLGDRATSGDFATAWISHGKFPLVESYAYTILPNRSPEEIAEYAANPTHKVVAQDKKRHVVTDPEAGLTGYVFFQREAYLETGPVLSVNQPCLVLTEEKENTLRISVCDPDLTPAELVEVSTSAEIHIPHAEHVVSIVDDRLTVTLRGKWDFEDDRRHELIERTDLRPDHSTFAFELEPGTPVEVLLKVRP